MRDPEGTEIIQVIKVFLQALGKRDVSRPIRRLITSCLTYKLHSRRYEKRANKQEKRKKKINIWSYKTIQVTFIEDALQISTATHKDTSCACSKRSSKEPSVMGSLTYIFCSQGRGGPSPELGISEARRVPVLNPKILSRSLVGDWLLPTPMPCAREFKKCTGWIRKNKS